jgi:hypothetical protein
MAVYPLAYTPEVPGWLNPMFWKSDLFFSGHTSIPFMLMFIFWQKKSLRYTFMATTAIFALTVLFMKVHYSIDVFGALFITHSLFVICKRLFRKDYAYALEEKNSKVSAG